MTWRKNQLDFFDSMMEKKYRLTDETIMYGDRTLHRIEALRDFNYVKKGDKGGFVESEANLSHESYCWVYDDAKVFGNACVYQHACVFDTAQVRDDVEVYGHASIVDEARVVGCAKVYDRAIIADNSYVGMNARIYGDASIADMASVTDYAKVFGDASVLDNACIDTKAEVYDYATINGFARIGGRARIHGYAAVGDSVTVIGDSDVHGEVRLTSRAYIYNDEISRMDDYIVFKNWWSSGRYFTWTKRNNMWSVGCFHGTGDELIAKAYKDSELSGREYERVVRYVEAINQPIKPARNLNRIQKIVCKLFRIK